ncbi:helix-turn-helix domain-containing protein [Bradyrhizobium barranii]|uniref:helix-turn-helix domain-containing protein n=1 Tax=Bradyrhizobium TaxID=374 RepID=UPI0024AED76C|nr:helix-turn-helix domain-containing protein [Bradyrhizobium barranii]WFT95231.1 helix-turn-helix domain-containing protein [Bradyrhizobium barranii]
MPADNASHVAAREDERGPPREVTTFKLRDEWVRLAAVQELSPILRVVGMRLAHFRNGETGQLNPSYATLAKECGTTERTAQKAVAEYRKIGMIADTRVPGGRHDATNDFTLIIPYRRVSKRTPVGSKSRVSKRTPVKPASDAPTGVRPVSGRVSRSVADGCPPVHPNKCQGIGVMNSGLAAHGERTADADRESAKTTPNDAPVPATDRPVARTASAALQQPLAEQEQPPPCRATSKEMERPVSTDADPAFAEVYQRGREVLGDDADAVITELLAAHDGYVDAALDTLAVAEEESDPRQYVQMDIEAEAAARRQRQ